MASPILALMKQFDLEWLRLIADLRFASTEASGSCVRVADLSERKAAKGKHVPR
jgi:hypothetical protein